MPISLDQNRERNQSVNISNGPMKDMNKDAEFDNYIPPQHQQQQTYGAAIPGVSDPYYYQNMTTFPYVSQAGINEAAWSTGGDAMFSVGNYDYSGMFGFGYPQFNWEFGGSGDYWSAQQRKDYNDYYRADPMQMDAYGAAINGEMDPSMKAVEQGMKSMTMADKKHIMEQYEAMQPTPDMLSMAAQPPPPPEHFIPQGMPPPPLHGPAPSHQHAQVPIPSQQSAPKKSSWAAIASQPARQQVMPPRTFNQRGSGKHNMDIGMWDGMGGNKPIAPVRQPPSWQASRARSNVSVSYNTNNHQPRTTSPHSDSNNVTSQSNNNDTNSVQNDENYKSDSADNSDCDTPESNQLDFSLYNPTENNLNVKGARFFIIKSYSEDDIHRSIKYNIWCSTEHGNKRLDGAFNERDGKGPVYLLYSVNGSGHFCGVAQMMSTVDYSRSSSVWAQQKWKGQFQVKWIYVKDVPNSQLRYIRLENNDNKPVTNSRDTQEVPLEKGKQMLKIIHNFSNATSIFDDFDHYEKRQDDDSRRDYRPQQRR